MSRDNQSKQEGTSIMVNLNSCTVMSGGLVDLEKTLHKVADAVAAYNITLINDLEAIGNAVEAVFAQYPGASITKPALVSLAMNKLGNVTPEVYTEMSERTNSYIDGQVTDGKLAMKKGKGGGVTKVV